MKITFEELLDSSDRTWLKDEIQASISPEVIDQASKDGFFDVKLVINGIEVEPYYLNTLLTNTEKHINLQAKSLIREQLAEAEEDVRKLRELVKDASVKIMEKYSLDFND